MSTRQSGFTYLFVLILIALIGLGLGAAGTLWRTDAQRAREADLLFIGNQYRQAIQSFYELNANAPRLPRSIDELLEDKRQPESSQPVPVRHLRRAWRDPITGDEFVAILAPDGTGLSGVASRSTAAPFKQSGFDPRDAAFNGTASYAEWHFVFTPATQPSPASPQPVAATPPTNRP
jgi:type II secretory pathway pseudopilin PulG